MADFFMRGRIGSMAFRKTIQAVQMTSLTVFFYGLEAFSYLATPDESSSYATIAMWVWGASAVVLLVSAIVGVVRSLAFYCARE